jgi:hypothetical protein
MIIFFVVPTQNGIKFLLFVTQTADKYCTEKELAMWKKVLWIYLGIYILGILALIINASITEINEGTFQIGNRIFSLLLLVPVIPVAFGLRGKKVSILLTLFGLLIIVIMVAGNFNFNAMSLETIGKGFLLVPMIPLLLYYGYKRLFKKSKPAEKPTET